ncbi:Crp/Fnr family transcriptional regulator [Cohaesibacter celericrescens]|nr:Crp/Fnr family transcriptional regulator [Cohaesibacter celericrescens]
MAQASQNSTYNKGTTIVHQGESLRHIGIVVSGAIKVTNVRKDGRQTIVALIEKGGILGGVSGSVSRFAYEAASDSEVCTMPQHAISRILMDYPEVAYRLLELTIKRSEEVQQWLTLFNCRTTIQRLAGYLSALCALNFPNTKSRQKMLLEIPIGRRDLGAYLGTTPETLSRNFHRLNAMGILEIIDGTHIDVKDNSLLTRVANESSEKLQTVLNSSHRTNSDHSKVFWVQFS